MAVDSFLLGRKGDPTVTCFSLLAPPRISLLGPSHGICGLFVVSAPGKLCIYACLYRSNAHGNLPADVPPALIQTIVTRTFARPAVNLFRVSQRKGLVQMQTCLWSTSALQNSKNHMGTNGLWTAKGLIRSSAIEFFTLSCTPKEGFCCHRGRHRKVFLLARMPRENKNSMYAHALVRPAVALSVWLPELSIHI